MSTGRGASLRTTGAAVPLTYPRLARLRRASSLRFSGRALVSSEGTG